jgi:hypothetical protein
MRTGAIGPRNGISEIASAADAPMNAGMSGGSRYRREHGRGDLRLVAVAVREQRSDRAVDEARHEHFAIRETAFALEEAARESCPPPRSSRRSRR